MPVDLWSIGCVFYEMLTKKPLFRGDSVLHQITKIFEFMGVPSFQEWEEIYQNTEFL